MSSFSQVMHFYGKKNENNHRKYIQSLKQFPVMKLEKTAFWILSFRTKSCKTSRHFKSHTKHSNVLPTQNVLFTCPVLLLLYLPQNRKRLKTLSVSSSTVCTAMKNGSFTLPASQGPCTLCGLVVTTNSSHLCSSVGGTAGLLRNSKETRTNLCS